MTLTIPVFVLASAAFYTVSMVAMKLWGSGPTALLALVIAIALFAAVGAEIAALRHERLGLVYVSILGVEAVMIAVVSWALFGESFSPRELAGGLMIVAGTALAWA